MKPSTLHPASAPLLSREQYRAIVYNLVEFPTDPEELEYEGREYRVWQNGEDWWVSNIGDREWSGATREIVIASAEEGIDEEGERERERHQEIEHRRMMKLRGR